MKKRVMFEKNDDPFNKEFEDAFQKYQGQKTGNFWLKVIAMFVIFAIAILLRILWGI